MSTKTSNLVHEPVLEGTYHEGEACHESILRPGNTNCGGCGMSIMHNMLSHVVGRRQVQMVIPACCGIVTPGRFPNSAYGAPVIAATFASAAAIASGLAHVAALNGEDTRAICFAGDGGTYDIGMATLSAAAERNEDVLYICYDNEIYGNTGGQRSSATPLGAATTTTPFGKPEGKKDILAIMAAHRIPYAASISLGHPADTTRKLERALDERGFRFLHVLSPCPTGWKSEPGDGVGLVRKAVTSGLFPVVEIEHGSKLVINLEPDSDEAVRAEALEQYFGAQGRFKRGVDMDAVRRGIDEHWLALRRWATT